MPEPLRLDFRARRYRVLPRGGGLDDQPVGLIREMVTAGNVYDIITSYSRSVKAGTLKQLHKNNPELVKQYNLLQDYRRKASGES